MNLSQLFHPAVAKWFASHFVQPTPAQAQAWPAIKAGRHTLIAAPTGSGKTLAAFLAAIDNLIRQGVESPLADATQVVDVSPLNTILVYKVDRLTRSLADFAIAWCCGLPRPPAVCCPRQPRWPQGPDHRSPAMARKPAGQDPGTRQYRLVEDSHTSALFAPGIQSFLRAKCPKIACGYCGLCEQLLAAASTARLKQQLTLNQRVQGSSPCAPTNDFNYLFGQKPGITVLRVTYTRPGGRLTRVRFAPKATD
jgi:DEAD/DEAH box helicase